MSITLVQQAVSTTNVITISTPAAGNSLIATAFRFVVVSVSGGGVTWTKDVGAVDVSTGSNGDSIWHGHNSSGSGTAVTVTASGRGSTSCSANISEWSGLTNANAEATNSNASGGNATVTTNSVTNISANALIIAGSSWLANDYSSGPTNSFTRMTNSDNGGVTFHEAAYQIENSIASYSTGWTLTAGLAWTAVIAVFGAPGGAAVNSDFFLLL